MDENTSNLLDPNDTPSSNKYSIATSDLVQITEDESTLGHDVDVSSACSTSDLEYEIDSSPFTPNVGKTSTPTSSYLNTSPSTTPQQKDISIDSDDDLGCWPIESTSSEDEKEHGSFSIL